MATKKCIAECLMAIKIIYPYFAKDTDEKALAKIWCSVFSDFPDSLIIVSLKDCLQNISSPPCPADIIKTAHKLYAPSAYERFSLLTTKLRKVEKEEQRFTYTVVEENGKTVGENARATVAELWETMPPDLKLYLGSQGEMIRLSRDLSDEALKFERVRFEKYYATQPKSTRILLESYNDKVLATHQEEVKALNEL
ncbi:MAG: replicative helicase loader/inhibitor [Ruminococcus sp.]|nr:replicative helicase loader/inhibitor [Ruminococcus sp.]MDY3896201.1 replicative helicase loader/inhibitor [Candidatus Fimenecus sp.]